MCIVKIPAVIKFTRLNYKLYNNTTFIFSTDFSATPVAFIGMVLITFVRLLGTSVVSLRGLSGEVAYLIIALLQIPHRA